MPIIDFEIKDLEEITPELEAAIDREVAEFAVVKETELDKS